MRFASSAILCAALVLAPLAAQASQDWNQRITELSVLGRDVADYRLGPGDLIEISVFGVEDFSYMMRISATGDINLPYLGRVTAAGHSAAQLEEKLRTLLDGRLIKNPQVFVSVKEYKAHPVFILGAVNRPGQYQMTQPLTLIDVIALAGGLDLTSAGDYATVQRRPDPAGGSQNVAAATSKDLNILRIDLRKLLESGSLENNIQLKPGDVIQIPRRKIKRFFILGDVNAPGAFALPDDRDLLLTQALAWAGGPARTAKMNKGTLVRYADDGSRTELAVNFKDVLSGKKPDFPVRENDIIFIPGSGWKTFSYGLLGLLPGLATAPVRVIR